MTDTPPISCEKTRNDKTPSLSQQVLNQLSEQISSKTYKPGDKLPTESSIAAQYGVSRSVVREAFSQLQARGLIARRRGAGTFVTEPPAQSKSPIDPELEVTTQDLLQLIEMRICLESESAALAAQHRTAEQMEALKCANGDFLQTLSRGENNTKHDQLFHHLIAEATGNRYFRDFIEHLGSALIPRNRLRQMNLSKDAQASLLLRLEQEHKDICNAIERQDVDGARTAMRMHLINSRIRLQHLLDQENESPLL